MTRRASSPILLRRATRRCSPRRASARSTTSRSTSPPWFWSIAQPTLLIHGYEDEVIPFAASSLMLLDLLPNAELYVFSGTARHWVQIEQTSASTRVLADFLEA